MGEEHLHQPPTDPAALMRRRHADLVHEVLRPLVRMDVGEGRGHAHHLSPFEGHGDVMARIGQELAREIGLHVFVEDVLGDPFEHGGLLGAEHAHLDLPAHRASSEGRPKKST